MTVHEPSFTIGIEEEYLLVDVATRALASEPPPDMLAAFERRIKDLVRPEFLKAQIEIGTTVCTTVTEARTQLAQLRLGVAEVANGYGLAPIAASTHPFSSWTEQVHTDKERYNMLARDLQGTLHGDEIVLGGRHVT